MSPSRWRTRTAGRRYGTFAFDIPLAYVTIPQWKERETPYTDREWNTEEVAAFAETVANSRDPDDLRAVGEKVHTRSLPEIVRFFYAEWVRGGAMSNGSRASALVGSAEPAGTKIRGVEKRKGKYLTAPTAKRTKVCAIFDHDNLSFSLHRLSGCRASSNSKEHSACCCRAVRGPVQVCFLLHYRSAWQSPEMQRMRCHAPRGRVRSGSLPAQPSRYMAVRVVRE